MHVHRQLHPLLVTHFFDIRFLDQRTVLVTGLTRDGTFLMENGKITKSLENFRWNESPLFMLDKLEELGRAERTAAGQVMPSIRVKGLQLHLVVGRGVAKSDSPSNDRQTDISVLRTARPLQAACRNRRAIRP